MAKKQQQRQDTLPKLTKKTKKLLHDFVGAHVEWMNKGSKLPEEWEYIDNAWYETRFLLYQHLAELEAVYEDTMSKRFPHETPK